MFGREEAPEVELKKLFWQELTDSPFVMLGLQDVEDSRTRPIASGSPNPCTGVDAKSLAMHPPSLWVQEHRFADLAKRLDRPHRVHEPHHLPMPCPPTPQEPEAQRSVQYRRPADRSDVTLTVHPDRSIVPDVEMRPRRDLPRP